MVFMNDKPMRTSLNNIPEGDYETAYLDAYDRARDLLDRGVAPKELMAAFDAEVLRGVQPLVITSGPLDDDETEGGSHPLADPPLKLAGLLQERYGIARDEAQRRVDEFVKSHEVPEAEEIPSR